MGDNINKVEELVEEYVRKWLIGKNWDAVDSDRTDPSKLMHILWDDDNIEDSDINWLLSYIRDNLEPRKYFDPLFLLDSEDLLENLLKIPEKEREEGWFDYTHPDSVDEALWQYWEVEEIKNKKVEHLDKI